MVNLNNLWNFQLFASNNKGDSSQLLGGITLMSHTLLNV